MEYAVKVLVQRYYWRTATSCHLPEFKKETSVTSHGLHPLQAPLYPVPRDPTGHWLQHPLISLYLLNRKSNEVSNMLDLHAREWLYQAEKVLLQKRIIKCSEMPADDRIFRELLVIRFQCLLKILRQSEDAAETH